jgi:hypothetical protein
MTTKHTKTDGADPTTNLSCTQKSTRGTRVSVRNVFRANNRTKWSRIVWLYYPGATRQTDRSTQNSLHPHAFGLGNCTK